MRITLLFAFLFLCSTVFGQLPIRRVTSDAVTFSASPGTLIGDIASKKTYRILRTCTGSISSLIAGVDYETFQYTLLNDTWLTAINAAGNPVNLLKISKDNLLEFGTNVGFNAFYFVQNPGFNYFADIPVSADGAGLWHGTGIRINGIDILKANIYGLTDSSRIEVPSIKMTTGAGYRKIPISRNSLGWLKYSAASYPDTVFANQLMAGTSSNVMGQLPLGTDRKILMGITDSVPKWKVPTTYDITPTGNRRFITPADTIQLDNLADSLLARYTKTQSNALYQPKATVLTNIQDSLNLHEHIANKSTNVTTDGASDIKYPSVKAVKTYADTKESTITAGTTGQYWRGDKTWQTLPTYTLAGLGGVALADSGKTSAGNYVTAKQLAEKQSTISVKTSTGNKTYYPMFTNTSSNAIDSVIVKTDKLTFNPSTGNLTASIFQLSDRRYKNHIKPLDRDDFWKIGQIEFRKFYMNDDPTNKLHIGVIAQEVEKIMPEFVNTDENGKKTVNYTELLLLKIAQLEQIIKDHEKRLSKLEHKNHWKAQQMIIP
jgi:hypothetical protein